MTAVIDGSPGDPSQEVETWVQPSHGVHIGIAMGDLGIVALRGFSRAHMGAIGDTMNVAARLEAASGPGETVVANTFFHQLDDRARAQFAELEPIEGRNVGLIKAWVLRSQEDRSQDSNALAGTREE